MGFTTRFTMRVTLLTVLAIVLMLFSIVFSLFYYSQQRAAQQLNEITSSIDQALLVQSPENIQYWLPAMMKTAGVAALAIRNADAVLYSVRLSDAESHRAFLYHDTDFPLMHHPDMVVVATYLDPLLGIPNFLIFPLLASVTICLLTLVLYLFIRWLQRETAGQKELEERARRILNGERESVMHGSAREWPVNASGAIDQLLADLLEAREERSRVDTLIRAFAAQDAETGLSNRLFFDNQLTTQLEDSENVGTHGIVMMIRLPDFETPQES